MEEFRQHNIKVPVLPSHASHVLQPFDLAVFGAFKATISKGDSSLRKQTLPERRNAMMQKARRALHMALCPDTILTSFERSGLHPYNPSIPLKHPCILMQEDDTITEIDENGKGSGERYIMSGKVITNLAEIEAIRTIETKTAQRKRAKLSSQSTPDDPLALNSPWQPFLRLPRDVVGLPKFYHNLNSKFSLPWLLVKELDKTYLDKTM
jgi:hypothetical protein